MLCNNDSIYTHILIQNRMNSAIDRYLQLCRTNLDPLKERQVHPTTQRDLLNVKIRHLIIGDTDDPRCRIDGQELVFTCRLYFMRYEDDDEEDDEDVPINVRLRYGRLSIARADYLFHVNRLAEPIDQIDILLQNIFAEVYRGSGMTNEDNPEIFESFDKISVDESGKFTIIQKYLKKLREMNGEYFRLRSEIMEISKNNVRSMNLDPVLVPDEKGDMFSYMLFDREVHIYKWDVETDQPRVGYPHELKDIEMTTNVYQNVTPAAQQVYLDMLGKYRCETKGQRDRLEICLSLMETRTKGATRHDDR